MATNGCFETLTIASGADHSGGGGQYKAVAIGGTIAAANTTAVGIMQNKPKSGEHMTVAWHGRMKAYAGGAINAGGAVKVTTSGYLVAVASGDGAVGKAVLAANSGSVFEFIGNFATTLTTY